MSLRFRKAIFLCLCVIPFSLFSGNGFAATGYEECKVTALEEAERCRAASAWCLAETGSPSCFSDYSWQCDSAPRCLYADDTACKYGQLWLFGPSYYNGSSYPLPQGGLVIGDENCIEPNPDETPPDPLENQLNLDEVSSPHISFPNECRGE